MSKHPDFRIRNSRVGSPESSGIEGADDRVIAWLTSVPAEQVSHDLAPEILAKVRMTHRAAFPRRFVYVLAAAATIALLLGGLWLMGSRPADPGRKAVAWLCQTQEPDGSWSSEKWGGDSHFEVALTGLSLLTLLEESARSTPNSGRPWRIGSLSAGEPRPEGAVHLTRIIDRAIAYLIQHQQPDGRFGDLFSGAPYNQGIATLALAKAYETRKSETLRQALDRAVSAIGARQYADGGWGYHHEARPASNLSITLWQVEALRLAALQGWPQVKPQVERGVRWMAGVAADDGSFGYQKSGDTP
ncbi:MAG: prenyltransferase/squalene oxidase repeat-containing protein, partial [bacterium]